MSFEVIYPTRVFLVGSSCAGPTYDTQGLAQVITKEEIELHNYVCSASSKKAVVWARAELPVRCAGGIDKLEVRFSARKPDGAL